VRGGPIRGSRAGGYHTDTVAEDADLTMALLRNGYRVQYEDLAACLHRGADQCQWADAAAFPLVVRNFAVGVENIVRCLRAKERWAGLLYPIIVIFQILLPLVSPFIDLNVRRRRDLVFRAKIFSSGFHRPERFPTACIIFLPLF